MSQETIKFNIRQDGTVTEEVMGVVGNECENLTKKIEDRLGSLSYREVNPEYYQTVTTEENVSLQHHQD